MFGILEALEHLVSQGEQPKRTFYIAFGHDEELSGYQVRRDNFICTSLICMVVWALGSSQFFYDTASQKHYLLQTSTFTKVMSRSEIHWLKIALLSSKWRVVFVWATIVKIPKLKYSLLLQWKFHSISSVWQSYNLTDCGYLHFSIFISLFLKKNNSAPSVYLCVIYGNSC